jgi:hypothetical protein
MKKKTDEIEKLMWGNDNSKPAVGMWALMQENYKPIEYNSNPLTPQDISEFFENAQKADKERRERMDKEYTPLSSITDKTIEDIIKKWGDVDSMPNNLMAKIKIGGSYIEIPIKTVILMHNVAKQEAVKTAKQNGTEEK